MTEQERNRAYEKVIFFISEFGFEKATTQKLMAVIGVSRSVFYNDFFSRNDLFSSCFRYIDMEYATFFDSISPLEGEDMRSFFYRVVGMLYDYILSHKAHAIYSMHYGNSVFNQDVATYSYAFVTAAHKAAKRADVAYHISSDVDPRLLWTHVFSETFTLTKLVLDKFVPESDETRKSIASLVLGGLFSCVNEKKDLRCE